MDSDTWSSLLCNVPNCCVLDRKQTHKIPSWFSWSIAISTLSAQLHTENDIDSNTQRRHQIHIRIILNRRLQTDFRFPTLRDCFCGKWFKDLRSEFESKLNQIYLHLLAINRTLPELKYIPEQSLTDAPRCLCVSLMYQPSKLFPNEFSCPVAICSHMADKKWFIQSIWIATNCYIDPLLKWHYFSGVLLLGEPALTK